MAHSWGLSRSRHCIKSRHGTCLHPLWPLSTPSGAAVQHRSSSPLHLLPGPHNTPYIQWSKVPLVLLPEGLLSSPPFSSSPPASPHPFVSPWTSQGSRSCLLPCFLWSPAVCPTNTYFCALQTEFFLKELVGVGVRKCGIFSSFIETKFRKYSFFWYPEQENTSMWLKNV